MVDLQSYKSGMSVHVDWSDDMSMSVEPEFLYLNNVRIIIQLRENCNTARVYQRKDRLRNNDFFSHEHNWQPVNLG